MQRTTAELQAQARMIREDVIRMLLSAGSGHSAGALGMADIFTALYFGGIAHDSSRPGWPDRDRVVLSNGHICPVLYATLAHAGYFSREELLTLRQIGSRLQGHPHVGELAGVEVSSGPLGQGISQAIGMTLAGLMDHKSYQVYALLSDGEHDEGQTWEAILFAGKMKLANLTAIVDRNGIQIDGYTEDVMPIESLRAKYESFNWAVIEIDGHDFTQINSALSQARAIYEQPVCIIAHTIPGKGVGFMEGLPDWHGKPPNEEQAYQALLALRTLRGQIEYE